MTYVSSKKGRSHINSENTLNLLNHLMFLLSSSRLFTYSSAQHLAIPENDISPSLNESLLQKRSAWRPDTATKRLLPVCCRPSDSMAEGQRLRSSGRDCRRATVGHILVIAQPVCWRIRGPSKGISLPSRSRPARRLLCC